MNIISEFTNKNYWLTKTDARVKLLTAFALLVLVLSSKGFVFPLFIAASCFALSIRMKVPVRMLLIRFSEPVFIALVLFFLKTFFTGNEPLFTVKLAGFRICGYRDGFFEGLLITSRILGAVSMVVLTGFATPFTEIIAGLSWFRVPASFVEILTLAYRYIFVLIEDAGVIYCAQKNRLGYSGIRRGLSSLGVLTGELVLRAFDRSQKTALAMEQRGYTGEMQVKSGKSFRKAEIICAALMIAVSGILWKIM